MIKMSVEISVLQGRMVDASTQKGDEGRGVAAKSFGEVLSNRRSGDVRMGKPGQANLGHPDI